MSLAEQQASYYRDPDTGFLMMPGSVRPDGTYRKPRRIKEGYVPQDEVPLYESKGKQLAKARESNPIPGLTYLTLKCKQNFNEFFSIGLSNNSNGGGIFNMKIDTFDHKALIGPPKIPGLPDSMLVQNANPSANADNTKKSNKKKKKNSNSSNNMAVKPYLDPDLDYDSPTMPPSSSHSEQNQSDHVVDPAKKLRNLRKKLRDIETLEKKFADGAVANPEPEQLEKVARKPVMIEEIMALEAMVAKLSA